MYQTSSDSPVAIDQPCAISGVSATVAAASSAADSAYTVASEDTATSRAASPGMSAMQISQVNPTGANTTASARPMCPAKLVVTSVPPFGKYSSTHSSTVIAR